MSSQKSSSRYCSKCQKAHSACICAFIRRIDCDIPIIILQHSSEAQKAIGTARILSLSLPNVHTFVGENFSEHTELNLHLASTEIDYALLYPAEQAQSIDEWKKAKDQTRQSGLILLDGTWRKAYKMYQLSTNIHRLPCVTLAKAKQSQYRIRKSSKAEGLSTVEAGFYALSELTKTESVFMPLFNAFDAMIDFQLKQIPKEIRAKHYNVTQ